MSANSYAMLRSERFFVPVGVVAIMSELAILTESVRSTLLDVSGQAAKLGTGLMNAAPGDKGGVPNPSIQYLIAIADELAKCAEQCEKLSSVPSSDTRPQSGI